MTIAATAMTTPFPASVTDAFALSASQVRDLVAEKIAGAYGETPTEFANGTAVSVDGSPTLESPQAVMAVNAFNALFGKKRLIKLSKVAEKNWSSIGAVAALIYAALQTRKAATV
jgi:hypothetical protein